MTSQEKKQLLQSLANTVADYRAGEIDPITPDHVECWLAQFDEADQPVILREMDRLLTNTYVSKERAEEFLAGLLDHEKLFGPNPQLALSKTQFLDIQRKGSSQKDLLVILGSALDNKFGMKLDSFLSPPATYVYIDDALFSGNTVVHDIETWLPSATCNTSLEVIFFGAYSSGERYLQKRLGPKVQAKGMKFRIWALQRAANVPWETQKYECLWPKELEGDDLVTQYVEQVNNRCEGKSFTPRLFRPAGQPSQETLFSSPAARDQVEHAFLKAGAYIVSLPANPKAQMRPLGYEFFESLGFGAVFVTYRNISNNCPLALWWGDPSAHPNHPFRKWNPLLPRKANAPTGFGSISLASIDIDDDEVSF